MDVNLGLDVNRSRSVFILEIYTWYQVIEALLVYYWVSQQLFEVRVAFGKQDMIPSEYTHGSVHLCA